MSRGPTAPVLGLTEAERVDHRSYERQGIEREATQHIGHAASAMERRGETTRIGEPCMRRSWTRSSKSAR